MPRGGVGGTWRVPGDVLGVGGRLMGENRIRFRKKIFETNIKIRA